MCTEARRVRVTGGALAGRRLHAPAGSGVRPTSDRVREALFARIPGIEGGRVLDLYAGTGALGIEALSRGARDVVFVERGAAALRSLDRNLEQLGVRARARVLRVSVRGVVSRLGGERFDLVLSDPPYAEAGADRVLAELADAGLLAPDALLVREASRHHPPGELPGLVLVDERRYGDTLVVRYRCAARAPAQAPERGAGGPEPDDPGEIAP